MQTPPRVSVVMPVYNAAAHLPTAVGSILAQTMPDFELLVVDDGSTDGSGPAARALAAGDPRVRVVSQPNGGVCAARNRGLAMAAGTYIAFCDDDDAFLPDALARMLEIAERTGADIVRTGYRLLRLNAAGTPVELPHPPGVPCALGTGRDGAGYIRFLQNSGPQFVWNALYRRAAIGPVRFEEGCRCGLEDFIFNAALYARGLRAVYDPAVTYRHTERAGGASACSAELVLRRLDAVPLWLEAEYRAAARRTEPDALAPVWNRRKAEAVTFLMHQLRDAALPPAARRAAWGALRRTLAQYPHGPLDFLRMEGQNKKQRMALFLYTAHLQGLYGCLPNREERLLSQ